MIAEGSYHSKSLRHVSAYSLHRVTRTQWASSGYRPLSSTGHRRGRRSFANQHLPLFVMDLPSILVELVRENKVIRFPVKPGPRVDASRGIGIDHAWEVGDMRDLTRRVDTS